MIGNIDKINGLLEKYFEGETSLQEEELIKDYFRNGNIDKQHEVYAPMFGYFASERKNNPTIIKTQTVKPVKKQTVRTKLYYIVTGAVACALVLIGINRLNDAVSVNNGVVAYINGEKVVAQDIVSSQALLSIQEMISVDNEILDSQIDVLDSFIE